MAWMTTKRNWLRSIALAAMLLGGASVASADLIVPGQPYRRPNRRPEPPLPAPSKPEPRLPIPKVTPTARARPMTIVSPVFKAGGSIPQVHTCEGADTSPPLVFADVPTSTKSLALIVDDPDAPDPKAPKRTWVHWVLWNLPPATSGLVDDASAKGLPEGTAVGRNDWDNARWGGPCPPIGRHRYVFKLYALDTQLPGPDAKPWTKADVEGSMQGHILASAQLTGTYQKILRKVIRKRYRAVKAAPKPKGR